MTLTCDAARGACCGFSINNGSQRKAEDTGELASSQFWEEVEMGFRRMCWGLSEVAAILTLLLDTRGVVVREETRYL